MRMASEGCDQGGRDGWKFAQTAMNFVEVQA
jgi:hypothetical protein